MSSAALPVVKYDSEWGRFTRETACVGTRVSLSGRRKQPIRPPRPCTSTIASGQVRHNGYLTKRFKNVGSSAPWSRQFCTVHGNILRCFAGKIQYGDGEDPVVRERQRSWYENAFACV